MANIMNIEYFAWVKERLGKSEEQIEFPEEVRTIADIVEYLSASAPEYEATFSDLSRLRFAIDQEFAGIDAPINGCKELAVFPPVTGG